MKILIFLSQISIPLVIFYIVAYGLVNKCKVYEEFVKGAKDGLKTVAGILPTLIGLMVAVGVLRASGFLDLIGESIGKITEYAGFPGELVPLTIVRMFSSSAAKKFFNTDILLKMLDDHRAGKNTNEKTDDSRKIWTVYIFLVWYDRFFEHGKPMHPAVSTERMAG